MTRARARYEITAVDKTGRAFQSVQRNAKETETTLNTVRRGLGAFGAALSVTAVAAYGKRQIDLADNLGKTALKLGETTEALSTYGFIAERSGVQVESFYTSLQRQSRRIAEAAQGTGEAAAALEELGLNAQALSRLSVTEQFDVLSQALRGVESSADRVRLAFKLWDAEGVANLQIINQTDEALEDLKQRFIELGGQIDNDFAQSAATVNDSLTDLQVAVDGLGREMLEIIDGPLLWFIQRLENITTLLRVLPNVQKSLTNTLLNRAPPVPPTPNPHEWANYAGLVVRVTKANKEQEESEDKKRDSIERSSESVVRASENVKVLREFTRSATTETDRLADVWGDLGFSFESAFERAIVQGEKLRDVMRGLVQDLARIVLRQTVTAPLAQAVSGAISGAFAAPSPGVLGGNLGQYYQPPSASLSRGISNQFAGTSSTPVAVNITNNLQSLDPSNAAAVVRSGMLSNQDVISTAVADSVRRGGATRQYIR